MQKSKKTLFISLGVVVTLVLLAIFVLPALIKPKLVAVLKEQANKNLNATLAFKDIDLSLLRNFPSLALTVQDLNITGQGEFQGQRLLSSKAIHVGVDVMAYLKRDEIKIDWVLIDELNADLIETADGKANYDIVKESPEPEKESSALSFTLKKLQVKDSNISYTTPDLSASVANLNIDGKADISDAAQDITLSLTADEVSAASKGVAYLTKAKTAIDLDAHYDTPAKKADIRKLEVALNELKLSGKGSFAEVAPGYDVDLAFASGDKTSLKSVLSLLPNAYAGDLKSVDASGLFSIDGAVKGHYNSEAEELPAFNVHAKIDDGRFKYAKLPLAVSDIVLDAKVDHPQGTLDTLTADVSKYGFRAGSSFASGNLTASKPVSGPAVNLNLKSHLDLDELTKAYPLEGASIRQGVADTDVALSSFGTEVRALTGKITAKNVEYQEKGSALWKIAEADVLLAPKATTVRALRVSTGKSDASLTGTLSPLPTLLAEGKTINADLALTSNRIDIGDFASGDSKESDSSTSVIPAGIDATLRAKINEVIYDKAKLTDVAGTLRVKDQTLRFDGLKANGLGGSLALDGAVATPENKPATFDLKYSIKNAGFAQTVSQIDMFQKFAPVAKYIDGTFSTGAKLSGNLDKNLSPQLNSVSADGFLQTSASSISDFKPLTMISSAVPAIPKKIDLKGMFAPFSIKDGALQIKEFPLAIKDTKLRISGTQSLDQSSNFLIKTELPANALQSTALASKFKGIGADLTKLAVANFGIKLTGTITDPKIAFDIDKSSLKGSLQEVAKQQLAPVTAQVSKLLEEAQAQAAEIRAKAQVAADKLKAEGDAKAAKLEAQGKDNPLKAMAAKEGAKALRKETDKQANALIKAADKQANELIQKAQQNVDKAAPTTQAPAPAP